MESNIPEKALKLKNITMKYHTAKEETLVINGLNLSVYDNEFLTILGPSGCGKSTILSLISGLIFPSEGEVKINKALNKVSNQCVGYMLQQDYLFEWRSIKQNVLLGLEIKKILNKESEEYALSLLYQYGLGEFLDYYPSQLSGGMRQKVALIRTLAVKPQILLLDEPFSALDYQTRLTISEEVRDIICKEKKTAVLVTHDISEAISLSDRIAVLSGRPSAVKKILDIDFGDGIKRTNDKRKHKKFNEYFDVIWSELNNEESSKK